MKDVWNLAMIRVTRRCNLNCPECSLKQEPNIVSDMTWDQWVAIVKQLKTLRGKVRLLTFTGGEPTLWKYLVPASELAKTEGIADSIRICTNAMKRGLTLADYGACDHISITEYGALNRFNIYHLRKQAKGTKTKVCVRHVVHNPLAIEPASEPLPAECPCVGYFFTEDAVYPCGHAALRKENGCPVAEDFVSYMNSVDPMRQDLCLRCFSNKKNQPMLPFVAEAFVWDTDIEAVWASRFRMHGLRRLYRWYLKQRNKL